MGFFDSIGNIANVAFPFVGINPIRNLLGGGGGGGGTPSFNYTPATMPTFDPNAFLSGLPKVDPNSIYKPQSYNFTYDPLLSPTALLGRMDAANKALATPTADVARGLIAPHIPIIEASLAEQANQARANAQSDFLKRGLTGSSTELYTIGRDIPAAQAKALSEAETNLITGALPIAQQEKQMAFEGASKGAEFGAGLRKLVGEEQFNKLSLEQKDRITQADISLKVQLDTIDKAFQANLESVRQAFEFANNEADRQMAAQKYNLLLQQQQEAKKSAFLKSGLTLAGTVIGGLTGGMPGALIGGNIGGAAGDVAGQSGGGGDMFGFLTS